MWIFHFDVGIVGIRSHHIGHVNDLFEVVSGFFTHVPRSIVRFYGSENLVWQIEL